MKKVVMTTNPDVVDVTLTSIDRYYGVFHEGYKAFITRDLYNGSEYMVVTTQGVTTGNYWQLRGKNVNLQQTVANCIHKGYAVYEFNTHTELFEWLAKP